MKSIILTILLSGFLLSGNEVSFIKNDYNEAIRQSEETGKPIFIDFYTTWCGPCKMLDKYTFKDEKVAKFMNTNFINLKIDCEKDFGINLSMKYRVRSYPSFALIDNNNRMYAKDGGYRDNPDDFLELITKFYDAFSNQQYFSGMNDKIDLDYPEFYVQLFNKDRQKNDLDQAAIEKYLNDADPLSEEYFAVYSMFYTNHMDLYVKHFDDWVRLFGEKEMKNFAATKVHFQADLASEKNDIKIIEDALDEFKNLFENNDAFIKDLAWMESHYLGKFYMKKGDWKSHIEVQERSIKYKNVDQINEFCWELHESDCPPEYLEKPISWLKNGIDENTSWAVLDTYAVLLHKTGQFKEALKQAKLAVERGKAEGQKTEDTEKLIEQIERDMEKSVK